MTEGGKTNNDSSEEIDLEKSGPESKSDEKKTEGEQVNEMLECSLCQVITRNLSCVFVEIKICPSMQKTF